MVRRALVKPPVSRIGAARKGEIYELVVDSPYAEKYSVSVDRESAFEMLARRAEVAAREVATQKPAKKRVLDAPKPRGRRRQSVGEAFVKSVTRSIGSRVGTAIVRGILGSIFKGR